MRSGWWRGSSGVMAGFDRIDTVGQLSKQILGAVAGIFQDDGREILDLDASALATDALHHAVGLCGRSDRRFCTQYRFQQYREIPFSDTNRYKNPIPAKCRLHGGGVMVPEATQQEEFEHENAT